MLSGYDQGETERDAFNHQGERGVGGDAVSYAFGVGFSNRKGPVNGDLGSWALELLSALQ